MSDSMGDQIITGRSFKFEMDGEEFSVTSVDPGAIQFEITDGTLGSRQTNSKEFTVKGPVLPSLEPVRPEDDEGGSVNLNGVSFRPWRIQRPFNKDDLRLKKLFEDFATGKRKTNPSDTGSLIYLDRNGAEARRIDFFGITPTHYDQLDVDSRSSGATLIEELEIHVTRCKFG